MTHHRALLTTATALLLGAAAQAQIASALVREGIALPGGPVGETITSISCLAANNAGGYGVRLDSTGSGTTLSHVWGHATGGAGAVLLTEGSYAPFTQTSFESFFGVDDLGVPAVSPTVTGGVVSSADSVWFGTTPIAVEGYAASVPGQFWRFASRPGVTANGIPYFVGGLTSTSGGSTQNYGFFYGLTGAPVVMGGDLLPNLPGAVGTSSSISFDYGVSALGAHNILKVNITGATSSTDTCIVVDAAGLLIGGTLIREGNLVPVAAGGNGVETWTAFRYVAINESGDYLLTADTNAATTADEVLLVNGTILHREGDTVDGFVLTGATQEGTLNEAGTIAYVWEVVTGAGNKEALFRDDDLVLMEGDAVDLDGDGIVEPTSIVTDLGSAETVRLAPNGDLFVVALIDTLGTTSTSDDVDAVFRIASSVTAPTVYCTAGTTTNGCNASIAASANPSLSVAQCQITVSNVEGSQSGLVFYGLAPNAGAWGTGTSFMCVKSPLERGPVQNSGGTFGACDGALALDWDLFMAANPAALGQPWAVGNKAYVQGWFRDPPAPKTTNLSNAIELTYLP